MEHTERERERAYNAYTRHTINDDGVGVGVDDDDDHIEESNVTVAVAVAMDQQQSNRTLWIFVLGVSIVFMCAFGMCINV